jgi:hypothetical protein
MLKIKFSGKIFDKERQRTINRFKRMADKIITKQFLQYKPKGYRSGHS